MDESKNLEAIKPDRVFDGGDLDCGSGLVLLLRDQMAQVPVGGILEMRSREPTVSNDLPPWCRMVHHAYLGFLEAQGHTRYFVCRGEPEADEAETLNEDKQKAKAYAWRLRARTTGPLKSTVYFRNFSIDVGQPASFEEKDRHPSAVEVMLAALGGALSTGFATECAKQSLEVDDIEISLQGRLHNVLAHLGLEEGDPSFESIALKCFVSTFDDEGKVREAWARTVAQSPLVATLQKAVPLDVKLAVV